MNLKIFSKGLYSSWGYYAPARILFDVGEGCATNLGNYIYAPESVFISHGHGDHTLGLPSLIGCRNSARGDRKKPLNIFYHKSQSMTDLLHFVSIRNANLRYGLKFIEIKSGFTHPINKNSFLEAFDVKHAFGSLGYKIMEKRTRLRADVAAAEAKDRVARGEIVHEEYLANVFSWTLDSADYDTNHVKNCAWLVADATFLSAKDRDDPTHASVEEVIKMVVNNNVKRVTLAHFSSRYSWSDIKNTVPKIVAEFGYTGKVDIIIPDGVYELS